MKPMRWWEILLTKVLVKVGVLKAVRLEDEREVSGG